MLLALALAALLAAADPAAPPAGPTAAAAEPELKPGERKVKMICRTEQVGTSRVLKRRCMSVEDWKRQEEESQQYAKELPGWTPPGNSCRQTGQPC